jgi:hypothetical protein
LGHFEGNVPDNVRVVEQPLGDGSDVAGCAVFDDVGLEWGHQDGLVGAADQVVHKRLAVDVPDVQVLNGGYQCQHRISLALLATGFNTAQPGIYFLWCDALTWIKQGLTIREVEQVIPD